jgi:hypothetical protein
MSIVCRLLAHAPVPSRLWNGGYYFTKCARCECDLIRRGGNWMEVPAGYQVVWREVEGPAADWTPWSPSKLRKDPGLTEILAPAMPDRAATAAAALVVDQSGATAEGQPALRSPDFYRRRVA